MIQIKNATELDNMRKANGLSAAALKAGGEDIEAGITTAEIDKSSTTLSCSTVASPTSWVCTAFRNGVHECE